MSFLAKLRQIALKKKRKAKITWLGLDRAGKTTLIRRVSSGDFDDALPRTMGMNVDKLVYEGDQTLELVSWDLGGQVYFRASLWTSYMENTNGIIFVVDTSDRSRFAEAKRELWEYALGKQELAEVPILILANKQDLPGVADPGELATALGLNEVKRASFMIMPVSAKTGYNIKEALDWLADRILASVD